MSAGNGKAQDDFDFDFSDLPETSSGLEVQVVLSKLVRATGSLARWARAVHLERTAQQTLLRGIVLAVLSGSGAVVVAIGGAIWTMASDRAATAAEMAAMREDIADLREAHDRSEERFWNESHRWHRADPDDE